MDEIRAAQNRYGDEWDSMLIQDKKGYLFDNEEMLGVIAEICDGEYVTV